MSVHNSYSELNRLSFNVVNTLSLKGFLNLAEIMSMELSKYFSPKNRHIFSLPAAIVGITLYGWY